MSNFHTFILPVPKSVKILEELIWCRFYNTQFNFKQKCRTTHTYIYFKRKSCKATSSCEKERQISVN